MADMHTKQMIRDVLRNTYFKDREDVVEVTDGPDEDSIHVVIISRKFNGQHEKEKDELIWSLLGQHLEPDDWSKVTLSAGPSADEVKAM